MICPNCGTNDPGVYVGMTTVECTNSACMNFHCALRSVSEIGPNDLYFTTPEDIPSPLPWIGTDHRVRFLTDAGASMLEFNPYGDIFVLDAYQGNDVDMCRNFIACLVVASGMTPGVGGEMTYTAGEGGCFKFVKGTVFGGKSILTLYDSQHMFVGDSTCHAPDDEVYIALRYWMKEAGCLL